MSRTHRRIPPRHEYLRETWYKHQEEKRFGRGKGVWARSNIKRQHSSNRVQARIAAQNQEERVQIHNKEQR
jgi:hypothetical protein